MRIKVNRKPKFAIIFQRGLRTWIKYKTGAKTARARRAVSHFLHSFMPEELKFWQTNPAKVPPWKCWLVRRAGGA